MQKQEQEELSLSDNNNNKLYSNFIHAIRTHATQQNYLKGLRYYMEFLNVKTLKELVDKPQKIIESDIKDYLIYLRTKKKLPHETANTYLAPIRKFYYVNSDYQFKWDLINLYLGNDDNDDEDQHDDEYEENNNDDRPYTMEEIKTMFNASQDIRVKIIISLLSSSGLRHVALPSIKLKHLEKIEKYNLYQITAYGKSKKYSYKTFCSPECSVLIDTYLSYRKNQGEILKPSSPLIREQFNTNDKLKVNNSRHLTSMTLRFMINEVLTKYTNLRNKLSFDYENRRKEGKNPTKLTHGFRKFFNTECAKAGVYPDFIELMLGHKLPGVRSHYMKPDARTLLEGTTECKGYLAAIDALTINDENRLQKQVQELKEQDDYQKYVIDKKIKEKDEEIAKMRQAMRSVLDTIDEMRNDFAFKQKEKAQKDKEINEKIKKMDERSNKIDFHLYKTEMLARKLDEVEQKRQEMFAKKGFVTKEDEEAIKNSIIQDVRQNDPNLWRMLFEKK